MNVRFRPKAVIRKINLPIEVVNYSRQLTNTLTMFSKLNSFTEYISMWILKRLVVAWKRHGTWKFIYLVGKNLRFYIEKLFSGDVLQSTTESEFDDEFGTDTEVIREIGSLDIALSENALHAVAYEPSPYHITTKIIQELSIDHTRFSFLDFGSGKGRVLLIASQLPFKSVIGIEFSRELCEVAKDNIAKFPPSKCAASWVECVHTDVMEYRLPGNPLVCYFYNPFDQVIMEVVVGRLVESLREIPREIYVIYLNPENRMLFDNSGLWDVISESDLDVISEWDPFVIYRFHH
ncbi:MAG: class I SAM-dependent methyltransferase [Proteobacteria bacterium]|nr:class I SAM-dependent methyltransferase [Pseudomonadota bacterium]